MLKANQIAGEMRFLERLTGARRELARQAAVAMAPLVRSMIEANVEIAGIKSHTGTLRRAVRQVKTGLSRDARAVVWFWPAGLTGYKTQPNFYAVANALNYGAVRSPKKDRFVPDLPQARVATNANGSQRYERRDVIGARAKRTLKKLALGGRVSARARRALAKGRVGRKGGLAGLTLSEGVDLGDLKVADRSVSMGGHTVIRPRPFFQLSPAQKQRLAAAFDAKLSELTAARMRRAR